MYSRRNFVRLAAVAGASVLGGPFAFASRQGGKVFTPATLDGYGQGLLSHASLEKHVGSLFMAFLEDDKVAYMRLHTVDRIASRKSKKDGIAAEKLVESRNAAELAHFYTATFRTGGPAIPQDSYVLDHGQLGRNAVFLVPGVDLQGNNVVVASFFAAG